MARIELLRRVMPDAPIVVCVRNPIDTLASWKGSFPHLRDADLNRFPVDYRNHGFLTRNERERLQRIADTESVIQRRAMIWAYLADMALKHRDSVLLVRYEDLIRNPRDELKRILDAVPGFDAPGIQVDPLVPRSRRELLHREELDAIADHCGTQAEALGYRL
jgi:hypothetical protein